MKTTHALAFAALATIIPAACGSDHNDTPGNGREKGAAISFSNPFINNSVKDRTSVPATTETLDEFRVWGFVADPGSPVFEGNRVERDGNGWRVDRTEYWYAGQNYWFSAVAPYDDSDYSFIPVATASPAGYKGGGTLVFHNDRAEGETDLVYAFNGPLNYPEGTTAYPAVGLTFNHLLSQLGFRFVNNVSPSTTLEVSGLRIANVPSSGEIDLNRDAASTAWSVTPSATFTLTGIDTDGRFGYSAPGNSVESEQAYIIPTGTSAEYQVEFDVNVYNGTNRMATYSHTVTLPASIGFSMGQSYRFTATFTGDNLKPGGLQPIEFTVDKVADWDMTDGGDID